MTAKEALAIAESKLKSIEDLEKSIEAINLNH